MRNPIDTIRQYIHDFDADELRRLAMCATDGIVATAGVVQGLNAADQNEQIVGIAALGALAAGALAAGGAMYYESAWDRDAVRAAVEKERLEHESEPGKELDELTQIYIDRGVTPELAREVAAQLSAHDPIAVHAREELGLDEDDLHIQPVLLGTTAAIAFAIGSLVPLVAILLSPMRLHTLVTFVSVLGALVITAIVVARAGHSSIVKTVLRTLMIGVGAMVLTMIGGEALD